MSNAAQTSCGTASCDGCRELALIAAIRDIEKLCLDGYAFDGVGHDVVRTKWVRDIIERLPQEIRGQS